jgi:hypothetical protein
MINQLTEQDLKNTEFLMTLIRSMKENGLTEDPDYKKLIEYVMINTKNEKQKLVTRAAMEINFPDVVNKKVLQTVKNTATLIDHYSIRAKFNEMLRTEEVEIPGKKYDANNALIYICDLADQHLLKSVKIPDHVSLIAQEHKYHPVREWIDSVTWDGVDRMTEFYDSIVSTTAGKEIYMRKWAMSAVAALYHERFSCEGVLVLQGLQAAGKTQYCESLLSKELIASEAYKEGVTLDTYDKDSVSKCLSHWIVELGELDATFKKSDIAALKAFITEKTDEYRMPYARKTNRYSRQTVFMASVNDLEFLSDDENRRFWVIEVDRFNPVKFDILQFWAQMKVEYQRIVPLTATAELRNLNNEYGWFLSPEERSALGKNQEVNKTACPVAESLDNHVRVVPYGDKRGSYMNATMILKMINYPRISKAELNKVSKWLRKNGAEMTTLRRYWVQIIESNETCDLADLVTKKRDLFIIK